LSSTFGCVFGPSGEELEAGDDAWGLAGEVFWSLRAAPSMRWPHRVWEAAAAFCPPPSLDDRAVWAGGSELTCAGVVAPASSPVGAVVVWAAGASTAELSAPPGAAALVLPDRETLAWPAVPPSCAPVPTSVPAEASVGATTARIGCRPGETVGSSLADSGGPPSGVAEPVADGSSLKPSAGPSSGVAAPWVFPQEMSAPRAAGAATSAGQAGAVAFQDTAPEPTRAGLVVGASLGWPAIVASLPDAGPFPGAKVPVAKPVGGGRITAGTAGTVVGGPRSARPAASLSFWSSRDLGAEPGLPVLASSADRSLLRALASDGGAPDSFAAPDPAALNAWRNPPGMPAAPAAPASGVTAGLGLPAGAGIDAINGYAFRQR
jgi:hypothetical protein